MTVRYAKHQRSDQGQLLTLFQSTYPSLDWSPHYLNWQYYQNPAGDARNWVAWEGDAIIGNVTAIPHRLSVHGTEYTGWRIQDVMTDPHHRGKGVFKTLLDLANAELLTANFPVNFTFPNESSFPFFLKSRWSACQKIPLWKFPIDREVLTPAFASVEFGLQPITRFSKVTDSLWSKYDKKHLVAIDRTSPYMNWRYIDNPRKGFIPLTMSFQSGEKIVTVFKYFNREDGTRAFHICDIFGSKEETAVKTLLDVAKQTAYLTGCQEVSLWHTLEGPYASSLKTAGFVPDSNLNRWHVRSCTSLSQEPIYKPGGWHISMGDSDVY